MQYFPANPNIRCFIIYIYWFCRLNTTKDVRSFRFKLHCLLAIAKLQASTGNISCLQVILVLKNWILKQRFLQITSPPDRRIKLQRVSCISHLAVKREITGQTCRADLNVRLKDWIPTNIVENYKIQDKDSCRGADITW